MNLLHPFTDLFDQHSLHSYAAAVLFAVIAVPFAGLISRRRRVPISVLLRFLLSRRVFLHASSLVDYRLYVVNLPILVAIVSYVLVGADAWQRLLATRLGPSLLLAGTTPPAWPLVVAIGLAQALAMDFGYWFGHLLMHRTPLLWEFHKVHHSAEVMTFATEYRQHPFELLFIPTFTALGTGVALALAAWLFGPAAAESGEVVFAVILLAHLLTFHHLRHSHIGLSFTGAAGHVLHSPGHHRLHHSADRAHHDCNLGYIFTVWDWVFGTLVMPRRGQRIVLGIGPEGAEHRGVVTAFILPLRRVAAMMRASRWLSSAAPRSG